MTTKCIQYVCFRLHMYAKSTWLSYATQNDTPCGDGIHVHSKMNVDRTFGSHGMGGGSDTTTSFTTTTVKQGGEHRIYHGCRNSSQSSFFPFPSLC